MGDDRTRILDLLATGKISVEEATRLLDALGPTSGAGSGQAGGASDSTTSGFGGTGGTGNTGGAKPASGAQAKFLFVKVLSAKGDNVNVKIPLGLVRAGLKLTSLIPKPAADQINKTMAEKGMSFDLNDIKPEDLEDLIEALRDMEVNIDAQSGDTVRVYAA
jgi:hypothetical protein